jgi:uncharacterized protein YkwD
VASRTTLLIGLIVLVLAAALPATVRSAGHGQTTLVVLEDGILSELNQIRADHGLRPLKLSSELTAAARHHNSEMLGEGYFEHESPGGSPFWKRVHRFYGNPGGKRWQVGENLLWSSPAIRAKKAVVAWMASPPHRQNILSAAWREIGIGALRAPSSSVSQGRPLTVITTDFGVRG